MRLRAARRHAAGCSATYLELSEVGFGHRAAVLVEAEMNAAVAVEEWATVVVADPAVEAPDVGAGSERAASGRGG